MGIHLRVTHEEKEVSCKICRAVFHRSKQLYNHMKTHRKKPCKFCWNMIPEYSLPSHVKICGGSLEGILKCYDCDYQTTRKQDLQRHGIKHNAVKEDSIVTCKECKKTFAKDKYLDQHIKVSHGKKSHDILRIIKWMRSCFGYRQFTPHIHKLIQKHLSRFDELHEAEKVTFIDRDGEDKVSVISKVVDVNMFVAEVAKERTIKKPKLIPGMDGSVDKCIVSAVIMEDDEDESEEDEEYLCPTKFKAAGSKRTFILAEVQGIPENRNNYEIIIKSLNLSSLGPEVQIVCDLSLCSALLGIQTASAMHGCPFCECFKVDKTGKKVNKRGRYKEVNEENGIVMRTWKNIELNNDEFSIKSGNRKELMNFKSCEQKPIRVKHIENENEEVMCTFPPEPLHTNLLGPVNNGVELLEKLYPDKMKLYYKEHNLKKVVRALVENSMDPQQNI